MEALTLDGLALHTAPLSLTAFDHKPAKKLLEWARNADSDGAKLLREPRHETAEIVLKVEVDQQSTMNAAIGYLGQVVDKLQEAERQSAGGRGRGLPLVWQPHGSTFTGTFYVLAGEVEDIPKEGSGDGAPYFERAPHATIRLTCHPFLYGAEVTTSTTTNTSPLLTMTVADVPGDVPAEARVIVTDNASQSRDFVAVGIENFYYNAISLLLDSSGFVTSGFAGTSTTRAGSYSTNVIRATLSTTPVAVCSSPEMTSKGTFRNYFRVYPSSANVSVRMAWRQGRDQWTAEPWHTLPATAKWCEPDLGQSKIRPALLGTQSWQWRLEAKSTVAGDTVDVDIHELMPSGEGHAKARRVLTVETPTTFTGRDEFDQTAGALTGKTAPVGGVWVGAGDADDFQVESTGTSAQRTAVSDADANTGRYAVSGASGSAAQVVQIDHKRTTYLSPSGEFLYSGVLARYADTSNHLLAVVDVFNTGSAEASYLVVKKRVAGTVTELARAGLGSGDGVRGTTAGQSWWINTYNTLTLLVDAAGRYFVWWDVTGTGSPELVVSGQDSALAAGGALASGKPGFYDAKVGAVAVTRNYNNFVAYPPTADAACFSGQSIEFRSYGDDPVLREDSTGTYWGRPAEARGGRMWLPCAGSADRTSRVAVMARRNDTETQPSENVTDSTSVAVAYRPRWVAIPRQA